MKEYVVNDLAEFTLMRYFNEKKMLQMQRVGEEIRRHVALLPLTEQKPLVPQLRIVSMGDLRV